MGGTPILARTMPKITRQKTVGRTPILARTMPKITRQNTVGGTPNDQY